MIFIHEVLRRSSRLCLKRELMRQNLEFADSCGERLVFVGRPN